jgi:selenocysteine lyase/cysteine desulfurase
MRSDQWERVGPYLDTASFGLPPRVAWDELQRALEDWRRGRGTWERWGDSTERARRCFARIHGVPETSVAVGATVSELVGLVAASIPDGTNVLTAEGDFASLLHPWAIHGDRGVDVRSAPLATLADAVDPNTDVIAVSVVQSANGAVVDLAAVVAAARKVDALVVVDGTQACGWLPLHAADVDALICAGYKWLLAPRGTAYLYVGERLEKSLRPLHASWYAADRVHGQYYGLPPRLAASARRLDTSPAWFSWVGAAPALELLEEIGIEAIRDHNVALANRFRAGLGLEAADTAIVATEAPATADRLERAGIRTALRAGSLRASFHLYNTEDHVDAALAALTE